MSSSAAGNNVKMMPMTAPAPAPIYDQPVYDVAYDDP